MNLVEILNGRNIAGVQESTLKTILEGTHPSIDVRMASNGMVMLSDNTIIKCVQEYYQNPNSFTDIKKHRNSTASCHYVQDHLDIKGVDINQCRLCHLRCMEMKANGELRRIYK